MNTINPSPHRPCASTFKDALAATPLLTQFINPSQLKVMQQGLRGEEKQYFIDKFCEYADRIKKMPATGGQESAGEDAIAYLHYFVAGCDWYVTEKPSKTDHAFGIARINAEEFEWGSISIEELVSYRGFPSVELDLHFTPRTVAEILNPQPKPVQTPVTPVSASELPPVGRAPAPVPETNQNQTSPSNPNNNTMNAKLENGNLVITIPTQDPTPSATGKTMVVASTRGNVKTNVQIGGKTVTIGLNAYIPAR